MAGTTRAPEEGDSEELPELPTARAAGCPFDPPPGLRALGERSALQRIRLWNGSTPWLVSGYDDHRALLSDPRVSADGTRPGYPIMAPEGETGLSFIMMDDPEHARLRRRVTVPFAIKRVEAMRPAVQKIVDDLIDDLLAGPNPVDLVEAFALPVQSLAICELLGVPYTDHDFFQDNSKTIIRRTATPDERMAAIVALGGYLNDLIARKAATPAGDLLSEVAARVKAGELTEDEAAAMGILMLLGGHETTANMIALGTLALLEHPGQLAMLRESDDPKLAASAVEELLRYLTITHGGRRRVALEDIEIGGRTIRAGDGLVLPAEIANRDPAVFPDPDRLDIERDARRHVAFSFGVHQCLGQPLAITVED